MAAWGGPAARTPGTMDGKVAIGTTKPALAMIIGGMMLCGMMIGGIMIVGVKIGGCKGSLRVVSHFRFQ